MKPGSLTFFLVFFFMICTPKVSDSHASIAHPEPISYVNACRVGRGVYCPGPCPNKLFRKDKPITTVRRGQLLRIKTKKNNHFGGFARWSIVRVKDMWKKHKHVQGAFYYTCHDVRLRKCTYKNRELCKGDRKNQFYTHKIWIPLIYPDGDYVLSFAWYGGLYATKTGGDFGDYYDCMFIRVRGGNMRQRHWPTFNAGPTSTGKYGMCKATTNRLGVCYSEPCRINGRVPPAKFLRPYEFSEGRYPGPIECWQYA